MPDAAPVMRMVVIVVKSMAGASGLDVQQESTSSRDRQCCLDASSEKFGWERVYFQNRTSTRFMIDRQPAHGMRGAEGLH